MDQKVEVFKGGSESRGTPRKLSGLCRKRSRGLWSVVSGHVKRSGDATALALRAMDVLFQEISRCRKTPVIDI